jgi:hypothetical protein
MGEKAGMQLKLNVVRARADEVDKILSVVP